MNGGAGALAELVAHPHLDAEVLAPLELAVMIVGIDAAGTERYVDAVRVDGG